MLVRNIFRLSYAVGALFMLAAVAKLLPEPVTMAAWVSFVSAIRKLL
jgi:hypothetical protein